MFFFLLPVLVIFLVVILIIALTTSRMDSIKITPKDFFLHLASLVTLYISAGALIALLFQIINISFPDALSNVGYYYNPYTDGIRWSIASLIIIFPLYVYLTHLINKDYAVNPAKRDLGIRKWLTFFTLFVAGAVIAGDLIVLLNTFLGGEITTRFVLKVIAIFVVSALVFSYYVRDLRSQGVLSLNERRLFRYGSLALVIAALIVGFVKMGSPGEQRQIRFDAQRVTDLQSIQWQVVYHYQQKGEIPETLAELYDPISGFVAPVDPETGEPYEYYKKSALAFDLCASFRTVSTNESVVPGVDRPMPVDFESIDGKTGTWQHGAERTCFPKTIDPELYPVNEGVRP